MGFPERGRRLIVNADDFGRSHSINRAVIRAHEEGILTTASLMVNGDAFAEAVELARQHPQLGVGLHLTLVCGRSTLPKAQIPDLVGPDEWFSNNPVSTGMRLFFRRSLREQLRREMAAQVEKFRATGLELDHLNGHLNLHLHPTVFALLMEGTAAWKLRTLRLTKDPFWLNARLASGRWAYRLSHAVIFGMLCRRAEGVLDGRGLRHTEHVFGLLQNGEVDEAYLLKLLPELPAGDSELYSHPSLDEFRREADALISPQVRRVLRENGIGLIRYQDL